MITLPAVFAAAHKSTAALLTTIVEITDGATTWYFSEREMDLTDGHVYSLLKKHSGISESVDPYTCKWSVPNVTVTMSNAPFLTRTGTTTYTRRLSDVLYDVRNQVMKIYLGAGSNITSLSDCVERFVGLVVENPQYNQSEWSVWAVDYLTMNDLIVPRNTIDSSGNWTNAPLDTKYNKIPLAYGTYSYDPQDASAQLGLAWMERCVSSPVKAVASDHQLKTFGETYIHVDPFTPTPALIDATESTNDSGYGTSTNMQAAYARLFPSGTSADVNYSFNGWDQYITTWYKSVDSNTSTSAIVYDGYDSSVGVNYGMYYCSFPDYASGTRNNNDIGRLMGYPITDEFPGYLHFVFWVNTASTTVNLTGFNVKLFYTSDGSTDSYIDISDGGIATTSAHVTKKYDLDEATLDWDQNIVWHPTSGRSDSTTATAYGIVFGIEATFTASPPYVLGDEHVMQVHNMYLDTKFYPKDRSSAQYYAACGGRTYGTWIDGHPGSVYSSGDLIEDGAGIIESILIDELGIATARIDMPSFDAAENSNVKMRVNLHEGNQKQASAVIREIAEQSTFLFCPTASGKMRCIDMESIGTATKTIHWSWIIPESFKVSKSSKIINQLDVESRYRNEADAYADKSTISDATSQSNFGLRAATAKWPYIAGTSVTTVAEHYVKASTGLWSNENFEVEFESIGYTLADLEDGDWVTFDPVSCDPQLLLMGGATWSGGNWLVVSITQTGTSTKVKLFLW
uniref:Uncharacterized protein n=1 Tax=viral metagenome TaxID=1070528 RepID=A0A6M3L8D5_9ZZZZ